LGINSEDTDLLAELMRAEGKISDEVLIQNCYQMITAGDTTPNAVASTLYLLAIHPEIQTKLRKEITREITDLKTYTTMEISKCKYLGMVVKESLRVLPPVRAPVPRTTTEEMEFSGIRIPAKSEVCYCAYATQMNERYWPNPKLFIPERWEEKNKDSIYPMSYFPFLAGNRNCIGQSVAVLELKVLLIEVLSNYLVTLYDPNYKLSMINSWITSPDNLMLTFVPVSPE